MSSSDRKSSFEKAKQLDDPSDDLLKTLIKEINIDEMDDDNIEKLSRVLAGKNGFEDSPVVLIEATSQSKIEDIPDGLEYSSDNKTSTNMLLAGLEKSEPLNEDLAHLLNQNFENDKSQVVSKISSESQVYADASVVEVDPDPELLNLNVAQPRPRTSKKIDEEINLLKNEIDSAVMVDSEQLKTDDSQSQKLIIEIGENADKNAIKNEVNSIFNSDFNEKKDILSVEKTQVLLENKTSFKTNFSNAERTVAVAGYAERNANGFEDKVKVSIGQLRTSPLTSWNSGDSNLNVAQNMEMAQNKIINLEKENEILRIQNQELISASEIIRERADLLASEMSSIKNDRDALEQSHRSEILILRNQLARKDSELQKVSLKIDELQSSLKFDMKKIKVRERELENRLELLRAEKNALVKNKDEIILDLKRKGDQYQMETDSFRQKCIELNKVIDSSNDSAKRTTRALKLAMANLELQDDVKQHIKKAE